MKAKILTTTKEVKREVEREFSQRKVDLIREIAPDLAQQVLSNVLITLDKSYGFKKQRLKSFLDQLHATCDLMNEPTVLTHRWTVDDNIKYLKDKYDIDLTKEFVFDVIEER